MEIAKAFNYCKKYEIINIKITKGSKYAVLVISNINGNKPPHNNCKIMKLSYEIGDVKVFVDTYAECEEYVKENYKNKS